METLILLEEKINEQEQKNFNYNSMNFEEEKRNERVNDDILNILGDYSDTTLLPEALDLFFIYLKKRPDRYTDFYHAANRYFNISKNSSGYNYYTQVNFLKKLYEYSEEWKNSIINQFFIDISKKMIKLVHNSTENWRNNSVRWHTIPVIFNDDGTVSAVNKEDKKQVEKVNKVTLIIKEEITPLIKYIKNNIFNNQPIMSQELVINKEDNVLAKCDLSTQDTILEIKTFVSKIDNLKYQLYYLLN